MTSRIAAPVSSLIATWNIERCRWLIAGALLSLVAADVITFTFHYPRNHLPFDSPTTADPDALAVAAKQWAVGNLVRVALVLCSWLCALLALGSIVLLAHA